MVTVKVCFVAFSTRMPKITLAAVTDKLTARGTAQGNSASGNGHGETSFLCLFSRRTKVSLTAITATATVKVNVLVGLPKGRDKVTRTALPTVL